MSLKFVPFVLIVVSFSIRFDSIATSENDEYAGQKFQASSGNFNVTVSNRSSRTLVVAAFKKYILGTSAPEITCNGKFEKIPVPGDCKSFYMCKNGQARRKSCPLLMNFDHIREKCCFSLWASCYDNKEMFTCKVRAGRVPHSSCDRFWSCQNYTAILRYCPKSMLFDSSEKACVLAKFAKCTVNMSNTTMGSTTTPLNDLTTSRLSSTSASSSVTPSFSTVNPSASSSTSRRPSRRPRRSTTTTAASDYDQDYEGGLI